MKSKLSWSLARAPMFLTAIIAGLIGANIFFAPLKVSTATDMDNAASEKFGKVKAEPALVLTIPDHPNELNDGLLQASEVSQLKLNADWVILSACDTTSAHSVGAEALSGLAREFLHAGTRLVIVSQREDQATVNLMTKIFLLMKDNPRL